MATEKPPPYEVQQASAPYPQQPAAPYPQQYNAPYASPPNAPVASQPAGVYYPSPQPGIVVTQPVVTVVSMQYGESPIATTCPHCHQSIVTAVTFEIGGLAWLICAILCLLGFWICAPIPFCVTGCKDVVHTCPSCHVVIGRHRRL